MKKIIIATIALIAFNLQSKAQSNGLYVEKKSCTTAIEYNDYLVDMMNMVDQVWTKSLEQADLKSSMTVNNELKTLSGKMLVSLKKLEGFGGETAFKNAAVTYITHMNNVSKKELPAFLKLIRAKGGLTTENEKKAEAYIPILDGKRERLFAEFENIQDAFATQHGFTIQGK
jgi:hypothetical protein